MSSQAIAFNGLGAQHFGIALWQADGRGPEPQAVGHTFHTPIGPITAHFYSASRDHDRIDPESHGGLVATETIAQFAYFSEALEANKFTLNDVVIKIALTTPTGDVEGKDWFYEDDVEIRHLRLNGPLMLELRREALIEFVVDRMTLTENYQSARSFKDVRILLTTDPIIAKNSSHASSIGTQKVAQAFLTDVANAKLQLTVDEIRLTGETFDGRGRFRTRFADLLGARLASL